MTTAENAGSHRRGRPRPQNTIERDESVYRLLHTKGPLTRTQVAEELGCKPSVAYMSLFRLRRDGQVQRAAGSTDARTRTWEAVAK